MNIFTPEDYSGWPLEGVDDTLTHKRVMGRGFGERRPVGNTRDRWEVAVRRDAVGAKLEGGSKEERGLQEGDRGGHGPKIGRSLMEKEEEEKRRRRRRRRGGGGGIRRRRRRREISNFIPKVISVPCTKKT